MASSKKPATSWRDTLKIHPAADLFPLMSAVEQRALGEDIVKNGLKLPIMRWRAHPKDEALLLDGRNRLDAIELFTGKKVEISTSSIKAGGFSIFGKVIDLDKSTDPYAYVVSVNINRRHLTAEQKRDLIAKLIKATPEKPDLQIAKTIKVSPTTVGTVRREMEAKGDVSKLETRIDSKGRKQPSRKPETPESRARWVNKRAEKIERDRKNAESVVATTNNIIAAARGDIGPDSGGELARKDAEIEQLRNDKRLLEIKITGLESEIEQLRGKPGGDTSIIEAHKKWEEAFETQRGIIAERDAKIVRLENENAKLRAGVAAPPADDGIDIPDYLDRTKQRAAHG